jgi:hypothetical protein
MTIAWSVWFSLRDFWMKATIIAPTAAMLATMIGT